MKVFAAIGFFIFSVSFAHAQGMILDKVIAKVGDEYVLLSEVEERYALASEKSYVPEEARCTILEELMVTNLLVHYARIDSMEVPDEEVEAQLEARISRILEMMGEDVSRFESYYGMTIAQAKELNRIDLRKQLNAQKMQSTIVEGITVTPSEVIEYFEKIPRDSLPYFNSEVEISEIVYKPKVNEEERNRSLQLIRDIKDRILAGESFEELAKKYSDDPGSAMQGGALGRTPRGTFVTEFEGAAYKLEPGEYSDVVETEFGYHIIRLNARYGSVIDVSHILIKPEITYADLDTAEAILNELRLQILAGDVSWEEAVSDYSDENVQSYTNGGRMTNAATGNTFFETADLDPDIFFAIDTMDVGGITAPISFRAPTGDVIYRLIRLDSRTAPHQASLTTDYSKVRNAAKQSKQNDAFNAWIEEKIAGTYVIIDPAYNFCPNLDKWRITAIKP